MPTKQYTNVPVEECTRHDYAAGKIGTLAY